jgi:hypothetical protein
MANPNIVNVSQIYGKTKGGAVTTSTVAVLTNSAGSNKIFKINSMIISNVDGTNAADITSEFYDAGTASAYNLTNTVTIPADATLVVISKETSIYLEEGDAIRLLASANGDLEYVISYEEIS